MVDHPGASLRPGPGGRLSVPVTADVGEDRAGRPISIRLHEGQRPRTSRVSSIRSVWKVNRWWWRGPEHEISRVYFELLLEDGKTVTVFRDLVNSRWMRHR